MIRDDDIHCVWQHAVVFLILNDYYNNKMESWILTQIA